MLTWPHKETDWLPYLDEITGTYVALCQEIAKRERLIIVTPCLEETLGVLAKRLGDDVARRRICFHQCPTDDTWARDHGFLCLTGEGMEPHLLDFRFNGWGGKFPAEKDNAINASLYSEGRLTGEYESHLDFVFEGGSIESDGRGTLLTTSACLLSKGRNANLSRKQIEECLLQWLHAERIIWIENGHLQGDDTDSHVDTLARFAPEDTIVYVKCDDPKDEHFQCLALMERELLSLRTMDGKPYRLLPLPLPRRIEYGGERLPATYANFLILNGAVLCPVYQQADLDARAIGTLKEAFPKREIVPIDSRILIRQHGSVHCAAMQFPKGVCLRESVCLQ